jgi:hypothetical protein
MKLFKGSRAGNISLALLLLVALVAPVVTSTLQAHAAPLTQVSVRFDRMMISTPTTGTICAKPATSSVDVKSWSVTFPTGYTVSTTAGNWQTTNISTANLAWPTGGTAWPNATAATAVASGQTVTWTNTSAQTMNNTTLYCYNWTSTAAISTSSSATSSNLGSVTTTNSTSTTIDTAQYNTATITNDQIVVTATVPSAFSFALSGNNDTLGTLSTGSVTASPTPRTATVNTNAKNGWMVWAKDSSAGLTSATASATIPTNCSAGAGSNSTLSAGTSGYNTGVTQSQVGGSGAITVASPFVGGLAGKGGGLCSTNLQTLASSTGTADTAVMTLTNNVAIGATQAAATDYTDTITVVAAGLF